MDILTRLGDAVHFVDIESQRYDIEGQAISVATPSSLYKMKGGTSRPLDHADAARLAAAFDLGDDVTGGR